MKHCKKKPCISAKVDQIDALCVVYLLFYTDRRDYTLVVESTPELRERMLKTILQNCFGAFLHMSVCVLWSLALRGLKLEVSV